MKTWHLVTVQPALLMPGITKLPATTIPTGFSESAGHFSPSRMKGTSEVGCGLKSCGGAWGDYIICSYKAAGNVIGEFADNVMPLA